MNRRVFLGGSATVAAATGIASAAAVPGGNHLVERRADFDAAAFASTLGRPAAVRGLYEAVTFRPGVLGSMKNALNGLQFGFGYAPQAIAYALAAHGPSAVYGYSDYLWQKYRLGDFFKFKTPTGATLASNIFLRRRAAYDPGADPDDPTGMYQDDSIEMLQRRGVVVLTCHTAVEEQARAIIAAGYASASTSPVDVAADILTHLIPGAVVVPSMVSTIAVLQSTYRYAYIAT